MPSLPFPLPRCAYPQHSPDPRHAWGSPSQRDQWKRSCRSRMHRPSLPSSPRPASILPPRATRGSGHHKPRQLRSLEAHPAKQAHLDHCPPIGSVAGLVQPFACTVGRAASVPCSRARPVGSPSPVDMAPRTRRAPPTNRPRSRGPRPATIQPAPRPSSPPRPSKQDADASKPRDQEGRAAWHSSARKPMTLPLHQAKLDSRLVLIDGAPTKPATPRRPKPKLPDPTHGAPQAKSMARSRSTQASLPLCRPSRRRGPDGPVRRAVFIDAWAGALHALDRKAEGRPPCSMTPGARPSSHPSMATISAPHSTGPPAPSLRVTREAPAGRSCRAARTVVAAFQAPE